MKNDYHLNPALGFLRTPETVTIGYKAAEKSQPIVHQSISDFVNIYLTLPPAFFYANHHHETVLSCISRRRLEPPLRTHPQHAPSIKTTPVDIKKKQRI